MVFLLRVFRWGGNLVPVLNSMSLLPGMTQNWLGGASHDLINPFPPGGGNCLIPTTLMTASPSFLAWTSTPNTNVPASNHTVTCHSNDTYDGFIFPLGLDIHTLYKCIASNQL